MIPVTDAVLAAIETLRHHVLPEAYSERHRLEEDDEQHHLTDREFHDTTMTIVAHAVKFQPTPTLVALTGWGQQQDRERAAEAGDTGAELSSRWGLREQLLGRHLHTSARVAAHGQQEGEGHHPGHYVEDGLLAVRRGERDAVPQWRVRRG